MNPVSSVPRTGCSLTGWIFVVAFLSCLAEPCLPTPQAGQGKSQNVSEVTAGAAPIAVETIVLDKKGKQVRNLKKDNFRLFEDGIEQRIVTFDEVGVTSGDKGSTGKRGKTVLILIDGYNFSPDRFKPARDSVEKFVHAHMGPQDQFAVAYYNLRLEMVQEFTEDPSKILDAINRIGGVSGNPESQQSLKWWHGQRYMDNQMFSESLSFLNSQLSRFQGRKAILFYSEGFLSANSIENFEKIRRTARSANVAYYTINARALETTTPNAEHRITDPGTRGQSFWDLPLDGMRVLAKETGGAALFNSGDFNHWLDEVDQELSNYYVLGFHSTNPRREARYRKLEVKSNLTGVTIKHRYGYVELGP